LINGKLFFGKVPLKTLLYHVDRRITHTNIFWHATLNLLLSWVTPDYACGLTLLKLHLVLGQSAGLVTKDEFNLTELFDEVGVAAESVTHILNEKHLYVVVDQLRLQKLK
jgi:hypothetical protein